MMIIQTESFSIAHNMNFAFGERKQSAKRKKVVAIVVLAKPATTVQRSNEREDN